MRIETCLVNGSNDIEFLKQCEAEGYTTTAEGVGRGLNYRITSFLLCLHPDGRRRAVQTAKVFDDQSGKSCRSSPYDLFFPTSDDFQTYHTEVNLRLTEEQATGKVIEERERAAVAADN